MGLKLAAPIGGILAGLLATSVAIADGEAGLVIDYGDGRVDTYCVPFDGESISGEALLAHAGIDVADKGGLVCAIGGAGCPASDCLCQCASGGRDCTYWAFFTQGYGGSWVYSALGYRQQRATDGELHAWKWGQGGPSSAPPPAPVTFEQVCGHPPGMVSHAPTEAPLATVTPLPAATPTSAAPGQPSPSPVEEDTATPSPSPTKPAEPGTSPPAGAQPTPSATAVPTTLAPGGDAASGGEEGNGFGLFAFAGVAGVLTVAIAAAVAWRRRHGA